MERKSLKDISWLVDEPTYRQDSALSYSTLATYERAGFGGLDHLFDRVESPSLSFGSCVDCYITEGEKAFNERYFVGDLPSLEPSVEPVVKRLFDLHHNAYTDITDISDAMMMPVINECGYRADSNWKQETKCKIIREKGKQYYQALFMANGKEIIPQNTYNKVFACVRALKDSPQTGFYFREDNPFEDTERVYQLKFKAVLNDIPYRCMADEIVVLHDKKVIIPVDLKTSSHREYDFYKSFVQWNYQIQSRLYWRIIRTNMDNDEYFKEFQLADYRFIVVNNIDNPNPLVWGFDKTKESGDIRIGDAVMRDPETIGKELYFYLQDRPQVPNGINIKGINSITEWLSKTT